MQTQIQLLRRQLARHGLTQTTQLVKLIFDATVHKRHNNGRFNLNSWTLAKYQIKTPPYILRDQLEKIGFAIRHINSGAECWDMEPCLELLKYINRYKSSIAGKVEVLTEDLDEVKITVASVNRRLVPMEAKIAELDSAIRRLITTFDPPFTEEKYQQYTKETSSDNDWD